jgi:archaetidylinositol phosphate synthase
MLERYRKEASPGLERLAGLFLRWTPNTMSWTSFSLSVTAAVLLVVLRFIPYPSPWVPFVFFDIAAMIFVGGVFDALDGYVARKRGLASRRGDFLDHVLDRYADTILLVGVALSSWADPFLGLLALVSLLLTSYMGTQAQAITGERLYGGFLGRADRIVLLTLGALFMFAVTAWNLFAKGALLFPLWGHLWGWTFGPLDIILIYFVVAGQATAIYRAIATWRKLQ